LRGAASACRWSPSRTVPRSSAPWGSQWNVDLAANYEINEHATVYLNILNAFDIDPQFDPSAAYSIFQYNPAWARPTWSAGRSGWA
jgi:outer membrane receptor protein involved in Fe transport